jgi:hypothetical protein
VPIEGFAKRAGLEMVDWFYDPAVSGAELSIGPPANAEESHRDAPQ